MAWVGPLDTNLWRAAGGRKLVLFNICGPPICFGAEWAAAFYELNSEKFIKHKNKEITQNCNQNSIAQTNML